MRFEGDFYPGKITFNNERQGLKASSADGQVTAEVSRPADIKYRDGKCAFQMEETLTYNDGDFTQLQIKGGETTLRLDDPNVPTALNVGIEAEGSLSLHCLDDTMVLTNAEDPNMQGFFDAGRYNHQGTDYRVLVAKGRDVQSVDWVRNRLLIDAEPNAQMEVSTCRPWDGKKAGPTVFKSGGSTYIIGDIS